MNLLTLTDLHIISSYLFVVTNSTFLFHESPPPYTISMIWPIRQNLLMILKQFAVLLHNLCRFRWHGNNENICTLPCVKMFWQGMEEISLLWRSFFSRLPHCKFQCKSCSPPPPGWPKSFWWRKGLSVRIPPCH